jgi:prephenate dehydrogenase
MTIQITVIGLNPVGISCGLALQNHEKDLLRIGSDVDLGLEQKALKLKAFDRCIHNLGNAVENADIILLNQPVDELHSLLEAIADQLKAGAVILSTAPLHVQVLAWAQTLLPAERYLLTFTPSGNPAYADLANSAAEPRADLFAKGSVVIGAGPEAHPDAVRLAADLAGMLSAKPMYFDPYEADGVLAFAHLLPYLNAAVIARATAGQAGWKESRKLAGRAFLLATEPLAAPVENKELGTYALLNGQNALRTLDATLFELSALRELIASQDEEGLRAYLETATDLREAWIKARETGQWDKVDTPPMPSMGDQLTKMFWFSKPGKEQNKKD